MLILRPFLFFFLGFPFGLGFPLGLGLGLRLGGDFGASFLGLLGEVGGLPGGGGAWAGGLPGGGGVLLGGGGALAGGAGGLPGGGGAFPGGIGGLAGGDFLGLCGGLGGGGGTLSAMTISYWQPEVLFERIGDMMSFCKNHAGYLISEIHGIGASFSIAPKPSSSITNKLEITSPPNLLHNLTHASTVPQVAKRSSIIIIFWPAEIASSCISSLFVPYSKEYSISIVE